MNKKAYSELSLQINEATKSDVETIVNIWVDTIRFHSVLDEDFALAKDGKRNFTFVINTAIYESSQIVYVAKINDEIVGFLYGYIKKQTGFFRKKTTAHISDIAVKNKFRRKGVGTALVSVFEKEFAKSHKAEDVTLYVHIRNKEGLEFYKKLNFKEKLISMKKKLNTS